MSDPEADVSEPLTLYSQGNILIIAPCGELDMENLAPLRAALKTAAATPAVTVIDLSEVTFGDSTFLSTLLRAHQQIDLRLAAPTPVVRRLLNVTGADQVLHLFPTLKDATTETEDRPHQRDPA